MVSIQSINVNLDNVEVRMIEVEGRHGQQEGELKGRVEMP